MLKLIAVVCLVLQYASGAPGTHCPVGNGMTDEIRQIFVDKHNEFRSLVAKGQAKNNRKYGLHAPRAARMRKMRYDCGIERIMMNWAKKCKFSHSPSIHRSGLGENMWMASRSGFNKTRAAELSVSSWFSELQKYGVPLNNKPSWDHSKYTDHYSQLVWQYSDRIGCAVVWCQRMTVVGCDYRPMGNFFGIPIYDVGEPCKTDADCRCKGCKCIKNEALCAVP